MFAWEIPFERVVNMARKEELSSLQKSYFLRCLYMSLALFTTRMAVFSTMLSLCLLYGNDNVTGTKVQILHLRVVPHSD